MYTRKIVRTYSGTNFSEQREDRGAMKRQALENMTPEERQERKKKRRSNLALGAGMTAASLGAASVGSHAVGRRMLKVADKYMPVAEEILKRQEAKAKHSFSEAYSNEIEDEAARKGRKKRKIKTAIGTGLGAAGVAGLVAGQRMKKETNKRANETIKNYTNMFDRVMMG